MDAIQLMLALFLHAVLVCTAEPTEVRRLDTKPDPILYQVQTYDCGAKRFEVWARACFNQDRHEGYLARPFLLAEVHEHVGFYLNQFGEVHASVTGGLMINDVYVPGCGT